MSPQSFRVLACVLLALAAVPAAAAAETRFPSADCPAVAQADEPMFRHPNPPVTLSFGSAELVLPAR